MCSSIFFHMFEPSKEDAPGSNDPDSVTEDAGDEFILSRGRRFRSVELNVFMTR